MVNQAALDKAVRRFPGMIAAARDLPSKIAENYVADMLPGIVREYRRIMAKEPEPAA